MTSLICFKCNQSFENNGLRLSYSESCSKCQADLHCCRQCEFYAPGKYNDCLESQAERVLDKEKRNYCDYFRSKTSFSNDSKKDDVLKKLDDIFK